MLTVLLSLVAGACLVIGTGLYVSCGAIDREDSDTQES